MQVLSPRCCGLDIHQKTVVACVLLTEVDGTSQRFVRTFGTMTADLLALGDWLTFHDVTHVGMESPGCSGVRCAMCWRRGARSSWSTPSISKRCRGAKRTSRTARGWRTRHAPWPAAPQLYPAAAHPRAARSHPLSEVARGAAHPRDQSDPQSTGDGQSQTGCRGEQCGGRQRAPHTAGRRAGRSRSRRLG